MITSYQPLNSLNLTKLDICFDRFPLKTSRMTLQGWRAKIVVYCIKFLVLIYDILSFPIYFLIDKPWNRWKLQKIIWVSAIYRYIDYLKTFLLTFSTSFKNGTK
ncbi:hypothetical protein NPIL_132891 [Nephila pilipes]|uniref:Uncharacterized protein n=1 Tax=Nephila pilipes TaxID=299642 RepID=A0A8X6P061_NEPPI|nr:hypothetical protein NPIL_132891 [Nephila pilipes]